jgi:phosphate transport system substrate-binding protein
MVLGRTTGRIAALLAGSFILIAVVAATVSAEGSSPSPVAPTASVQGSGVQLDWCAPTTSSGTIRQTGCDSVNMSMGFVFANFTEDYPSIDVTLKGGGNDVAFAEWIAGHSDVAQASRRINAEELQKAQAARLNMTETKVGMECIAFITDPGTGVSDLSLDQLRALYNGTVANWKDLGGNDLEVKLFGPPTSGSPHLYFTNTAMVGTDYSDQVIRVSNATELGRMVAATPGAVGFVRSGYLDEIAGVNVLELRNAHGQAASPQDLEAVRDGSYPLARYYYFYTDGAMTNATGAWAQYVLDQQGGQKILRENGFLPLDSAEVADSAKNIASVSNDPVEGYKIYREDGSGGSALFTTNETGYLDKDVQAGQTYSYSVSAVYGSGEGERSSPMNITVPASTGVLPVWEDRAFWPMIGLLMVGAGVLIAALSWVKRRQRK